MSIDDDFLMYSLMAIAEGDDPAFDAEIAAMRARLRVYQRSIIEQVRALGFPAGTFKQAEQVARAILRRDTWALN